MGKDKSPVNYRLVGYWNEGVGHVIEEGKNCNKLLKKLIENRNEKSAYTKYTIELGYKESMSSGHSENYIQLQMIIPDLSTEIMNRVIKGSRYQTNKTINGNK